MLILRRVRAASHRGNILILLGLFVLVHVKSDNENFDNSGCTWNDGFAICMIFLNVTWQTVDKEHKNGYEK